MKNVNLRVAHKPTSVLLDILVEYSGRLTIKFYKISSLSYKTWHFLRKPRLRGGVRLCAGKDRCDTRSLCLDGSHPGSSLDEFGSGLRNEKAGSKYFSCPCFLLE